MPTLHQFVPTLDPGAVGAHTLEIQRVLREAGWTSEVFSEHTRAPYDGLAHKFTDYGRTVPAQPHDLVVYHAAIGSSVADWLLSERKGRLIVDYHNITPPRWFEGWDPQVAYGLAWGRSQLRRLARRSRFGLADSQFNADELVAAGVRRAAVLPILVPESSLGGAPDRDLLQQLRARRGTRWLFVGRIAPNKRQHLLVAALAVYRRTFDPEATLTLVGGTSSPPYSDAIRSYARDLDIEDAVVFTGGIDDGARNAYYAASDVFVCLSAHEGFLVPLLEAWHHRLPIVAFDAAAVPETLGAGGLKLRTADSATVATAVARVCGDRTVGNSLRAAGLQRLADFSLAATSQKLLSIASSLVEAAA